MRTVRDAQEMLLHAMGWQERVAGIVESGQRQGWLPPGAHDGQKVVVELEADAELPPLALEITEAFRVGVIDPLLGVDGRRFLVAIAPGKNGEGDDVIELSAWLTAEGGDPLSPDTWKSKLFIGWGMNHGLLRETLVGWANEVLAAAPARLETRYDRAAVEASVDLSEFVHSPQETSEPMEYDPQFLHELRTLAGKYGERGIRNALDEGLGEWPPAGDSARKEAQRILDRGGRGSKKDALRVLGMRV